MNNVEIFEDFCNLLKKIHGTDLNQREEMLVRTAINHTMLIMQNESEDEQNA